ncbi:uncharacterized protein FIBRA_04700 [Fibroporia radiculosa]|uniref:Glycopeptide n=1 Tax=Fibroporia radiculosa TaxID=599839 RepID=J4HWP0_9APHY|nr:uncharacterized protein FIBRA_04700 [Fibroporia radiculosa]CCM02597.1 predicted protein [Fibroporia radiculosa]
MAFMLTAVDADMHTVSFTNNCGYGTPNLVAESGTLLSDGAPLTMNGPLIGAVAFLQTGNCGNDGEDCTTVNITLENGENSFTVNPPYGSSISVKFYNGCDGLGVDCGVSGCSGPQPLGVSSFANCTAPNVDLEITFCD